MITNSPQSHSRTPKLSVAGAGEKPYNAALRKQHVHSALRRQFGREL
jgi:hypothetical protein